MFLCYVKIYCVYSVQWGVTDEMSVGMTRKKDREPDSSHHPLALWVPTICFSLLSHHDIPKGLYAVYVRACVCVEVWWWVVCLSGPGAHGPVWLRPCQLAFQTCERADSSAACGHYVCANNATATRSVCRYASVCVCVILRHTSLPPPLLIKERFILVVHLLIKCPLSAEILKTISWN